MNNNKNLKKTRGKSNSELRKMYSEHGSDIGIVDSKKIDPNNKRLTKRSKLSHKRAGSYDEEA
ncbi:hypothetical protein [Tepidibacter hydrothermalis]|uniref:Small, acid-soluble spore protein, alpha/beta type n=1 Tax=Tepidibacter hydrothermalis TaxID=3036126 RepID=A0ABY8E7S0_9FIRM|nr:hypothetical protein [Tepidibacter hydrothermalis]WFD08951.1 hypothetical protein P4S50_11180 [Tepidibacter hydrothermalis]